MNDLDVKQHQLDGVKWCIAREHALSPASTPIVYGGILGDEMGLGKTFTIIGTMLENFKLHTLIVLPTILVEQWREIIKKTLNHNAFMVSNVIKEADFDEFQLKLHKSPIVITTYKLFEKNVSLFSKISWDRIVFDEAHHLRNHKAKVHKAIINLRDTCENKKLIIWLVTGTPIQNYIKDFYSLCRVLGLKRVHYYKNVDFISKLFMLKRTKLDVGISLPSLKVNTIEVDWESEEEKELGEELHSIFHFAGINRKGSAPLRRGYAGDTPADKSGFDPLSFIIKAKQSCIDMSLLTNSIDKIVSMGAIADGSYISEALKHCSKLNKVIDFILERKDNNRKKIIFCHYHKEIDFLKKTLSAKGFTVASFDGRVSKADRFDILTHAPDVLILQIQTGCEGLNLQNFNEIYFVSTHWNPAIQDQAIARCHRIGQTKCVDVFIFVMKPFDEERNTKNIDIHCIQKHIQKRMVML